MKQPMERLGIKFVGGLKKVSAPRLVAALLVDLFHRLELDRTDDKVLPAIGRDY